MSPSKYIFLLNYGRLYKDKSVLDHTEKTLDINAHSGLNDFVEGGFYRYTVEDEWKVPHFEKMLYDQAQMISLYSKAFKIFRKNHIRMLLIKQLLS